MAIERARTQIVRKPWGVADLRPWSSERLEGAAIGELWYERPGDAFADSSLLLKLLFTSAPLSIQVHPGDAFARSIGLQRGKSEAWYVLSAKPEAKVALGLEQPLNPQQLREAIADGSISILVAWQTVAAGDVIVVPAGTIHALGAGLVIAEIQQRSDATFRMFDYGRQRELQVDNAIAVADMGPAVFRVPPKRLTDQRTLLASNPYFTFERINLPPHSAWRLETEGENWLLVIDGSARVNSLDIGIGEAVVMHSDRAVVRAGATGMVGLAAYTGGGAILHLFQELSELDALPAGPSKAAQAPAPSSQATAAFANRPPEMIP